MDAITVAAMRAYHVVYAPHTDIGRSCKRGGLWGGGKILSLSLSLSLRAPTTLCREASNVSSCAERSHQGRPAALLAMSYNTVSGGPTG